MQNVFLGLKVLNFDNSFSRNSQGTFEENSQLKIVNIDKYFILDLTKLLRGTLWIGNEGLLEIIRLKYFWILSPYFIQIHPVTNLILKKNIPCRGTRVRRSSDLYKENMRFEFKDDIEPEGKLYYVSGK